eukprot:gene40325-49868_t
MQVVSRLFSDPTTRGVDKIRMLTNVDDDGRNVFHYAVLASCTLEFFQHLIKTIGHTSAKIVEDICLKGDNKGRTPLEYALAFKRDYITCQLFTPTVDQMCKRFKRMSRGFMRQTGQPRYLEIMKENLTIKGLTLLSWPMDVEDAEFFHNLLGDCVMEGFEQCVEWLLDGPWKLLERLPQSTADPIEYLNSLLVNSFQFCHPSYVTYVKKEDIPLVREKLKLEMYSLLKDWDGKSQPSGFVQDIILNGRPDRLAGKCRPRLLDPYFKNLSDEYQHDLFETYTNEYAMQFAESQTKHAVFQLLMRKADLAGRANVPLHLFILNEHPSLLVWYVKHYKIDLQASLSSDADLLAFAQEQPWTRNADGVFQSDLTMDQFLSVLIFAGDFMLCFCAYHGGQTRWLMDFTYNGLNLMQLAVVSGSYIVLKMVRTLSHIKWSILLDNDINAFHIAVQRNHAHVVEYLFPYFTNDQSPARGEDFTTAYYARGTTIPFLLHYYESMLAFQKWADLREMVAEKSLSAKSFKPLLVLNEFLLFEFEKYDPSAGSAEVTLMEESVRRGRIDVCRWIC